MSNEFKKLTDEELVDLLFTEGDELSDHIVSEFLSRGDRMIDYLSDIIMDVNAWQCDGTEWWAVIHATFILGAIGGERSVSALIGSMRFSDVYYVDWLWEAYPSIFGKIGVIALEPLKSIVADQSNPWMTRTTAFESMAAITINFPNKKNEVFDFIASIVKDEYEDMDVRGFAASLLLDFKLNKYKKSILNFVDDEEKLKEQDSTYSHHLDREYVLQELESNEKDLNQYTKNWLEFYSNSEIEKRQKRWKRERSLQYKILNFWYFLKIWYLQRKWLKGRG